MKKKGNDQNKVIIERVIDEELPPGWVKEIRIKKTSSGVRRDPLYNHTATGYVFRSRLDVFRYLETGEISKHAYKRKDGCRNDIQSMQVTASAATVRSNSNKGKETLQGSLLPNHCNSKVRETGSGTVSVGNNALLDLGDDVDVTPIKPKKVEGNENDVVCMDSDTKVSKSNEKRNDEEKSSSRRSSSRLAGIETELVTHTVAIERVLRAANKKSTKNEIMESSEPNQATQSQQTPQTPNVVSQEDTLRHCTEPVTVPSPNEIVGAGQIQLNEQCVLSGSKRKPERNRKKIVSPRPSSNLLAEIDVKPVAKPVAKPVTKPVIHSVATKRVLRSACSNSAKTEAVPSYGSEQSEQVKDATPVVNVASEEEIVCQYPESVKIDFFVAERIEENEECGNRRSRSRERKPKRNRKEIVSPITHGSQRVKDETPVVNVGSEEEIVHQYPESAGTPVTNDFFVAERIEDNEECGNRRSQSRERKPKRNRKEIVSPVTHAPQRVLRSASNKSSKPEDMPSLGSEQDNKGEAPPVINSREIVLAVSILPEDQVVKETSRCNSTDQTVIGCMTVEPSRKNVEVERIKETPTRNNIEAERITETPTRSHVEAERIKETPPRNNAEAERIKETPPRNNVEVERVKETPTRNNVEVERLKETPKHNSKNLLVTDEVTAVIDSNGKEKEQHDSHFSFPWSDPCIEFAYKTLTGALPLDDTLAIHDYVQHQIRTSSNTTKTFTHSDCRPSGFSLNTFPSNSSTSITFPDPGPPGFSRVPLVDARPPGFSLNDIPSEHSDVLILPDSGPPGFSRGNNLATPAGTPPGFSRSSNNFTVPDARPPQFSWSSVPPNSGNPPGFPWSTSPRNSVNNPAVPEPKPPSSPWDSVPTNIPAAKPAGPPGFPWSSVPSNSSNSPALPDAKPPGFSWSCVPPSSGIGINLNVALPDSGPPGFSQKIVPPAKQQHQQQTNPAGIGTQPAEFPFQGSMFTWNHRN